VAGANASTHATTPAVLNQMPLGAPLNAAFFLMLAIAALTSAISMLEALVAFARPRFGLSRAMTTLGMAALVFVAGIPSALAQEPYGISVLGRDVLTFVDAVASDVLLPLAGLLTAVFVGWVWGAGSALAELRQGAGRFPDTLWSLSVRLVIPATVGLILAAGLLGVS
jgi:NSS family neurotransmitter:Na+ symporter